MVQHLRSEKILVAALGAACSICSGQASASTIVAPVTASATSTFISTGNNYSINNTINQSGLSLGYESGVTDFAAYLASKPMHTSAANNAEWFSQDYSKIKKKKQASKTSVSGLSVTYGFSKLMAIDSFVLWNEEFAGLGTTQLQSSVDGITYTLLNTITPIPSKFAPNGQIVPYLAQVFPFELTSMLFFRLVINDCPGPPPKKSKFRGCGIGEVAFSAVPPGPSDIPPVPLPATLPLLGSAFGLVVWLGRRQKKSS